MLAVTSLKIRNGPIPMSQRYRARACTSLGSILHSGSESIAKKVPPPIDEVEDSKYQWEDEPRDDINPFCPRGKLSKKSYGAATDEAYEYATNSRPQ